MIYLAGYERKSGEFTPSGKTNSVAYDNIMLHVVDTEFEADNFVGYRSEQIKVKTAEIEKIFKCTVDELQMFVLKPIILKMSIVNQMPVLKGVAIDPTCDTILGAIAPKPEPNSQPKK